MRRARPTARAGFSLVELTVVVLVLALLSSVVYMTWEALLPRTRLNSAVRELASTLMETRSDAIARGAEFRIEYYFEDEESHPARLPCGHALPRRRHRRARGLG